MIAILTDFANYDPAYSLCRVVDSQIKSLTIHGINPLLIARQKFTHPFHKNIAYIEPGEIGNNKVNLTEKSEAEIESLSLQLEEVLRGIRVVLCHDIIYQPNAWKYHVALRRALNNIEEPVICLHWVHSSSVLNVSSQTGRYYLETESWPKNSFLVAFSHEEVERKRLMFDCPSSQVVILANAIDYSSDFHELTNIVIEKAHLWSRELVAIYPCRMDRGKQPHIAAEIVGAISSSGLNAILIIVDYHSVDGEKSQYREEIKANHPGYVYFTSEMDSRLVYAAPNRLVRELFTVSDFLIQPSMSEGDPLIVQEAAFAGCGLVLNYDLPVFREYVGSAIMGQFSSAIDVVTGLVGQTVTDYKDRREYMSHMGRLMHYQLMTNPIAKMRSVSRRTRNISTSGYTLISTIEALQCIMI